MIGDGPVRPTFTEVGTVIVGKLNPAPCTGAASATETAWPSALNSVTVAVVREVSLYPVEVFTRSDLTPAGGVNAVVDPETAVNFAEYPSGPS